MPQKRIAQEGIFHITTKTQNNIEWCTLPGIPEIIVDNLRMSSHLHQTSIYTFCLLPDHLHLVLESGPKGISKFMQSFKSNCTRTVRYVTKNSYRWQKSFHDEKILDEDQLRATQSYVLWNSVKHDLVKHPEDWPWSSLHFDLELKRYAV